MNTKTYTQRSKGGRTTARLGRMHDGAVLARAFDGDVTDEARVTMAREIKTALKRFRAAAAGEFDALAQAIPGRCEGDQRSATTILREVARANGDAAALAALMNEWIARAVQAELASDEARNGWRGAGKTWAQVEPVAGAADAERANYATASRMARLMLMTGVAA